MSDTRKTKMVCTIGPKTCDYDSLLKLAKGGMNVVRLNMSHGAHDWHQAVIDQVKKIRQNENLNLAIMIDTKGPEVRTSDIARPIELKTGDTLTITIERMAEFPPNTISINYDGFVDDIEVGDYVLIDSGILTLKVVSKTKTAVQLESLDDGIVGSRRHVNIRGKSANLPAITEKDWLDIDFGIHNNVEFFALSFVNDAQTVSDLQEYIAKHEAKTKVISKIESVKAIKHLEAIIQASDGIMVARGDLGAELPFEEIPVLQEQIVSLSRYYHKPVIVATQLLESMMVNPTPTRAEVTDIHTAVMQGADAIMMSGETANGNHPFKAQQVMHNVALATEKQNEYEELYDAQSTTAIEAEMALGAVVVANNIGANALIVFSATGKTATFVSEARPQAPMYVFAGNESVQRQLALTWGVQAYAHTFQDSDPEASIQSAMIFLKDEGLLETGDQVVIVSHIRTPQGNVHSVQVRKIA